METKANQGPAQPRKRRDSREQENMSDPHNKHSRAMASTQAVHKD